MDSDRGGDDWVDLGREEELHSSQTSSHVTNGNATRGTHPPENEEFCNVLHGDYARQLEEQPAVEASKKQSSGH